MTNNVLEPKDWAFSEEEFRGRVTRAKEALKQAGIDCAVCVGPELLYYYAGYDAHTFFQFQALIFGPGDDEPTLVMRDVDVGRAEVTSWVTDIRLYRHGADDPVAMAASAVKERLTNGTRVGADLKAYAFTGLHAIRLQEALAPATLEDFTRGLDGVRLSKSDAEMVYVRKAAEMATVGLDRAKAVARPGITEIALAGEVETAMRHEGTEYPGMPTWIHSGTRRIGHKTPDSRLLESGDLVSMEFAGVHRRYHAATMQTFAVGEPSQSARDAYNIALRALRAGCKNIEIGRKVADAEQGVVDSLISDGFDPSVRARFGYGVGIGYPLTWLESLDITLESNQLFERNMTFVLHTSSIDPGKHQHILVGGAYAVTDNGLEAMSGGDFELQVV